MSAVPDADAAAPAGVPGDKVQLTILLVSGKRHPFLFNPKDTIEQVKAHVAANWPAEWADEAPASASSLKVVHLGRFLADSSTLEGNKIPTGVNTIVHMTIKEPTPGDAEVLRDSLDQRKITRSHATSLISAFRPPEPSKATNSDTATCKLCVIL